ncbi:MAG: hypothetical protein IJ877_06295 [Candidatus Gastranaerophilales bacterium]|nr:hypothetical protein [bacterium]MBR2069355.1 hypothetical protein [Candidatus Gastranaerophilales bacterium]
MKKKLVLLVLGLFIVGYSGVVFADTTNTSSKPQPPQFSQNGGQPPQMNGEKLNNKRPKYKPDSQPGGKMTPKEWDNSSDNNFQGGQPPEPPQGTDTNNSNSRPPMPPKQDNSSSSES